MVKKAKNEAPSKDTAQSMFQKQNMVNALSYIPYFFGPILMFFLGDANKSKMMHHIKYALILAVVYVVLMLLLNDLAKMVINIVYLIASGYFAYQAYQWDDVKVELFDSIEEKIQEKVKK